MCVAPGEQQGDDIDQFDRIDTRAPQGVSRSEAIACGSRAALELTRR